MRIAPHFTLAELSRTDTGIPNVPDEKSAANLKRLAFEVLEPIRDLLECKLVIHSGYRCKAVNRAVGGVYNSAHLDGRAADFHGDKEPVRLQFEKIIKSKVPFDKIILEFKKGKYLIHVAIAPDGVKPRRVAYQAVVSDSNAEYIEVSL